MTRLASISFHLAMLCLASSGCAHRTDNATADQKSDEQMQAESGRAWAQEREADVVVEYGTSMSATELRVQRPEREQPFASEDALLAYLTERRKPKELLVVVFGKIHKWSDPKQTLDGFWKACKKTGFKRVVIQQGRSNCRPILHE